MLFDQTQSIGGGKNLDAISDLSDDITSSALESDLERSEISSSSSDQSREEYAMKPEDGITLQPKEKLKTTKKIKQTGRIRAENMLLRQIN